ncbi:uncharacterized protein PG998_010514 [Apiospora kogelbergensis]|uniref:uncharacterized protein n=1 Tax=Apiospora kogelbergensis TaxID=1337665 RepID=UPI003130A3B1
MAVDLTLPASSSPAIDPYKDLPDPLLPFALFVHVELRDDEELASIEEACNSESDGATPVQRAPHYDFSGQPLRAALRKHLDDWRKEGVVVVTMDDGTDDEVCQIDQLRVPVKDAGLMLVNLQIANADWADFKEEYGSGNEDNGDDNDDGDDSGPRKEVAFDSFQTDEEYSDGASSTLYDLDYYFGFYSIPGIDFETVMRELHPCWGPRVPTPELGCRPEGRVTADSQVEAVAQAKRTWPLRCRNNPHLHRGMFMIVDTPIYHEDGILLVKIDWDEKKAADSEDETSAAELRALGEAATTDTQRLPFANATTMTIFNEIVAGYRPWKHSHKTFLAYAGPQTRYPADYLAAVDKPFQRRKSGSERFLEKNVQHKPNENGETDAATGFQTTLDQHWGFVKEERFCGTLCPHYLVYCDMKLESKDGKEKVTLVKVDREGGWSVMDCKAGDAYRVLCEAVDKKKAWEGERRMTMRDDA